MSSPDIRVSDRERDEAVDRLRAAATEGRLDADELEERIRLALAARTRGDLDTLFTDLPAPVPGAPAATAAPAPVPAADDLHAEPMDRGEAFRRRLAAFLTPNVICIAIWAATGAGSFWPVWVLLGTGIGFAVFLIRFILGVEDLEPDHRRDRLERRERRIERRDDRRQLRG